MKWKSSYLLIRSKMSDEIVRTRSKKCMHLNFFSHIAGQKHFLYVQGHQGATEMADSYNNIQHTCNTAHEAQHQKTVITEKLGKLTTWFSQLIKKFCYHYFREN